jgi:Rrf2 family protein
VLVYLAGTHASARTTREAIIEHTGVPAAFLRKIVKTMVRAGLIVARPGAGGGCSLARPAQDISILQVIESMDGPIRLTGCLSDPTSCPRSTHCRFRPLLGRVQGEIIRLLDGTSIADVSHEDSVLGISPELAEWDCRRPP